MKESIIFTERNLTEKVHYVYRVVIDGYYYIGKRTGFFNDLITGRYRTSSKLIWEKLKNGKHFSKIKIIQVFFTSEEALKFEERILTRVDAKRNPKFLNQRNSGDGDFTCKQHTEKSKKKLSKKRKEYFNPETEQGQQRRKNLSNKRKEYFNPNTVSGRRNREDASKKSKAQFDPNSESGRKNLENHRNLSLKQFDISTEEGRKLRGDHSERMKEYFNPNTESGRRNKEKRSQSAKAQFDPNTERGRKQREKISETLIQKRKDASILSDLMFDEEFIRKNFLITDDKNNLRFLWSVYSKLTGYSKSHIAKHKREGKLIFLNGINSISISEEQELAKIEEIEYILKEA